MCGRYTLTSPAEALRRKLGVIECPDLSPRYNIAPTQSIAVVANRPERRVELFYWGLIPSWAKDRKIGNRMINARAESLAEKPSFRNAFRRRRCLVLADGFYEWRQQGSAKIPFYVRLRGGDPFVFAGLWEIWQPPEGGEPIFSCTIVTTDANELVATIHDRMPVILPEAAYADWLDPEPADPARLTALLRPYPARAMEAYAVSRLVNAPTNDRPECIQPREEKDPA